MKVINYEGNENLKLVARTMNNSLEEDLEIEDNLE
jgi:hypothetical protein